MVTQVSFLHCFSVYSKTVIMSFIYSRWLGGWAAEEAGTAGWKPRRSAFSPSTASWRDPSWLRPLASWVTRGSESDRLQLSRTWRENLQPTFEGESLEPPQTVESWCWRREGISWERVKFWFWLCVFYAQTVPVSQWGEWTCLNFLSNLNFTSTVSDSRAMHYTSPPLSSSLCLMLFEASGEAAATFMRLDRYAN